MAQVRLTRDADEQFAILPLPIQGRVLEILRRLADWPKVSGAKPLRGSLKGHFRLRTGDWRVIVRPVGPIVWVVRIDNRKHVYED
jgi:mRNA-degrading endonuclease RelE of RelBE toxin-antitoxin system